MFQLGGMSYIKFSFRFLYSWNR